MRRTNSFAALVLVLLGSTVVCAEPPAPVETKDLLQSSVVELYLNTVAVDNTSGLSTEPIDEALRTQLGLEAGRGLVVTRVAEGSDAARAGIRPFDLVLEAADQPVAASEQLAERVTANVGQELHLSLLRRGKPLKLALRVSKPATVLRTKVDADVDVDLDGQADVLVFTKSDDAQATRRFRLGVQVSEADETLRSQLRLAAGEGLVVTEVIPDSPSQGAGVQPYDVLVVLDGKRLSKQEALTGLVQEVKDREVELRLIRGGSEKTLKIRPRLSDERDTKQSQVLSAWLTNQNDELVRLHSAQTARKESCASCHRGNEHANWRRSTTNFHTFHTPLRDGVTVRWIEGRAALGQPETSTAEDPTKKPTSEQPVQPANAAAKIEQLKREVGQLQATLSALEALLASQGAAEGSPKK